MGKKNKQQKSPVSEMQKRVFVALQKEVRESAQGAPEIVAAVEKHLAGMQNSDYTQPQVSRMMMTLNRSAKELILSATVQMECAGTSLPFTETARTRMDWSAGTTEEKFTQQIRLALPPLEQSLAAVFCQKLPQSTEELYGKYMEKSHPKLDAIAEEIAKQPDVLAILEERKPAFQNTYRDRLAKVPCPAGFRPADITSLQLRCFTSGDAGKCVLQIGLDSGSCFKREETYDLGYCPFYTEEERQREYLQAHILTCVKRLVKQVGEIPPLFIAPSLRDLPGTTEHLETLAETGTVSLDHVTVKWKGICYENEPVLYLPKQSSGKLRRETGKVEPYFCPILPISLAVLEQPAIPLEQYTVPPQDAAGYCQLGETIEEALGQMFQGREVPALQMVLQLKKHSQLCLTCGGKSITLDQRETAAGPKLMQFLTQAAAIASAKPLERQRQLEVLNALNPTELAVLRYITAHGEIWYTALAGAIEDQVCTTKVYTGACLKRLAELKVPVDGAERSLLRAQWTYSRKHDDFLMYSAGANIERAILDAVAGRPFGPADVENMKPAERAKWFTNYLLEADDEQRWTRFNEALDRMPRTFLTEFAKSEAGQGFLRKFTGSEAMFVRLTVEELPGCKRLAAKLWPEEVKSGEK